MANTTTDYVLSQIAEDTDGKFTEGYLKATILGTAADSIFYARRKSGLTQEQIAKRLGKRQEAITRWEADTACGLSLRQYVELALACGYAPRIVLVPLEEAKQELVRDLKKEQEG
jgi:transcriptional regulator with XRE-family HTH domain